MVQILRLPLAVLCAVAQLSPPLGAQTQPVSTEQLAKLRLANPNLRVTTYDIHYEKPFPIGKPWPEDVYRAVITIDDSLTLPRDPQFSASTLHPIEVRELLMRYVVVPEAEWKNEYSHVAGGDVAGWITLPDERRMIWMLRPGGLGWIVYPDGGTVYLTAARHAKRRD